MVDMVGGLQSMQKEIGVARIDRCIAIELGVQYSSSKRCHILGSWANTSIVKGRRWGEMMQTPQDPAVSGRPRHSSKVVQLRSILVGRKMQDTTFF